MEGTITSQWYLQQLQNEIILVIYGAGDMNITFFQQDGASPHAVNVILDVLHGMFGSCFLSNQFPEHFSYGWSWPPCSLDTIPAIISLEATSKIMCPSPSHTLFRSCKLKLKVLLKRSQVTCCMIQLTTLWFAYIKSIRLKDLISSFCSHEDHLHTNSS
jgi:hypothetical protein